MSLFSFYFCPPKLNPSFDQLLSDCFGPSLTKEKKEQFKKCFLPSKGSKPSSISWSQTNTSNGYQSDPIDRLSDELKRMGSRSTAIRTGDLKRRSINQIREDLFEEIRNRFEQETAGNSSNSISQVHELQALLWLEMLDKRVVREPSKQDYAFVHTGIENFYQDVLTYIKSPHEISPPFLDENLVKRAKEIRDAPLDMLVKKVSSHSNFPELRTYARSKYATSSMPMKRIEMIKIALASAQKERLDRNRCSIADQKTDVKEQGVKEKPLDTSLSGLKDSSFHSIGLRKRVKGCLTGAKKSLSSMLERSKQYVPKEPVSIDNDLRTFLIGTSGGVGTVFALGALANSVSPLTGVTMGSIGLGSAVVFNKFTKNKEKID